MGVNERQPLEIGAPKESVQRHRRITVDPDRNRLSKMAAPAEGVTFSSWARSPQPEWPYKLVEPDTAPKLTPTSVTARIAIVDALYAQAKPADDPRLPIPTPAKKRRPGGPSPRSRGAHRPATRARRVAANAAQASPRPPPQALTLRECVVLDRAEGRDACDIVDEFTATLFAGGGADRARSALSRACARDAPEDVVRRMVRQALERLRKLRPAGLPMGSESKASATTGLVVGEAFQAVYGLREGLSRERQAGQEKSAKFPTSKAPISAVFHSFRLNFG